MFLIQSRIEAEEQCATIKALLPVSAILRSMNAHPFQIRVHIFCVYLGVSLGVGWHFPELSLAAFVSNACFRNPQSPNPTITPYLDFTA